jgi:hypothetical protein
MTTTSFERVEELVRIVESSPDSRIRTSALELLQSVLDLHGAALDKIVSLCRSCGDAGHQILREMGQDPWVSGVLSLHDLHPETAAVRVRAALDRLSGTLSSRGIELEFVGIDEHGVVRIKANGLDQKAGGLHELIEDRVLAAAPEIAGVITEGLPARTTAGFVPLSALAKSDIT